MFDFWYTLNPVEMSVENFYITGRDFEINVIYYRDGGVSCIMNLVD